MKSAARVQRISTMEQEARARGQRINTMEQDARPMY